MFGLWRNKEKPEGQTGIAEKGNNLTLCSLGEGERAVIVDITGGSIFQNRLMSMGLHIGCQIEVLRRGMGIKSPVLIKCNETRLAMGYGMASKVFVEIHDYNK